MSELRLSLMNNTGATGTVGLFQAGIEMCDKVTPGSACPFKIVVSLCLKGYSCLLLQIDFPSSAFEVKFTSPPAAEFSPTYNFNSLFEGDQRKLKEVMQKESLYW